MVVLCNQKRLPATACRRNCRIYLLHNRRSGADGNYTFVAWTELGTDEDLSNDTLTQVCIQPRTDHWHRCIFYSNVYGGPEPGSPLPALVYGRSVWCG